MQPRIGDIIGVWKPVGITSHDVIDRLRNATGEKRIGHAGTLDPMAEGILVVGVGREATKKLSSEVAKEKEYEAVVTLGATSVTDDAEGPITISHTPSRPTEDAVRGALRVHTGAITQRPPVYSALKVRGKPAHRRVRQGEEITIEPRTVTIKNIELLDYTWPEIRLRVTTGPGVYIRALARDIGEALGTGGYLSKLTRTRVGEFTREKSFLI